MPTLYLQREYFSFHAYPGLIILLLTSAPYSLNSRHTLRRAHTSKDLINLALQRQNESDVESYVSSTILNVMAGEDSYASNFYLHQKPVPVVLKETRGRYKS